MNELLPDIIFHFLLSLSLGTALFTWIADPRLTGAGFIRLIVGHGFIFLVLAVLMAWLLFGRPTFNWLIVEAVVAVILGIQWRVHPDQRTTAMWMLYAAQVILSIFIFYGTGLGQQNAFLFLLSSAVLLGITHYSMLLGHYYLVVPKLTEKPLLVCMRILWVVMFAKMSLSAWSTWQATPFLEEGTLLGDGYTFNWLVVSMRWLWGYGALLVLSGFAWRLCRMRSIQSATGVLYIMVFFVFIGELLSTYLFLKHGLTI